MSDITNWNLNLSRFILNAIPNGFISAVIEGERRLGKSAYALKNMTYVYHTVEGLDETKAWDKAIDNMLFTPEQLIDKVEQATANEIISPVWCIDDAAVHFSGYLYFINVYETAYLQGIFDTIGTVTNAVLLTCPKKRRLMVGLKNYDDYCIQIIKYMEWERIARGIKWFTMPDGRQRYRKMFEDYYSCYLPKWVFEKYMTKRKRYLKEINKLLKELKEDHAKKKRRFFVSSDIEDTMDVIKEDDIQGELIG